MHENINFAEVLNSLYRLISLTDQQINLTSILIIGSNYKISKNKIITKYSDIDFIVLNESKHFSIKRKFNNIFFDISFINHNDMTSVTLGALNGSSFFGKIFSSITNCNVFKDTDNIGITFVKTIKHLNKSFTQSSLPNFKISTIALHNISANKNDLNKISIEESSFALHRLSEHLFSYMSYLVYPFHTSGSYRGKIIEKHFRYFKGKPFNGVLFDEKSILLNVQKICPVLEHKFQGVVYDESVEKLILNSKIYTYYFGYSNLITEKIIVFLLEKDILKNNFKLESVNNIIPFLSVKQITIYKDFLVFLSKQHLKTLLEKRLEFLIEILKAFKERKIDDVIINSLKSLFIIKPLVELAQKKKTINIKVFHDWLIQSNKNFTVPTTSKSQTDLEEIFDIILDNSTKKEIEIKTCYIFFGILKSLRINLEDLNF